MLLVPENPGKSPFSHSLSSLYPQALDFNGGIEVPVHRFMVLKLRHALIQMGRGGDTIIMSYG